MPRVEKVSSADVAAAAGVSRTTVSYVLKGSGFGNIPDSTRKRVLDVAHQMGYRVNTLARGLKCGRSSLIGVYCRVREDGFHSRMLHGIHEICYKAGYNVLIAYLGAKDQVDDENLQRMLDYNITGVIRIVSDRLSDGERNLLKDMQIRTGTPCVLIDDEENGNLFDYIVSDDAAGARAVVEHLIGLGHTRIGHINIGNVGNRGRRARHDGFVSAMQQAGLSSECDLISRVSEEGERRVIRQFLESGDRPTAVFCTNDYCAAVAREAARELGLAVPGDLAIAGYGNTSISSSCGITSVEEQAETMGEQAVRQVLLRRDNPDKELCAVVGPTHLVVRESTAGNAVSS